MKTENFEAVKAKMQTLDNLKKTRELLDANQIIFEVWARPDYSDKSKVMTVGAQNNYEHRATPLIADTLEKIKILWDEQIKKVTAEILEL